MDRQQKIRDVARRIFFAEGKFDARLHEIASKAKVNKALVHYYFRNRENLMAQVVTEAMEGSFLTMFRILLKKEPFEVKMEKAVSHITRYMAEYPFIESFIISQINAQPTQARTLLPIGPAKAFTKKFLPEVNVYLKQRRITQVDGAQFIVNMMALCAYPSSTKPVIMNILGFDEPAYRRFLKVREKSLLDLVLMRN